MRLTPTSRIRRALAALTIGTFVLVACSSDDESSSGGGDAVSVEEFCSRLDEVASQDNTDAAALAKLDDLASVAPDEIAEDMTDFAVVFSELITASADTSPDADPSILEDGLVTYNELSTRLDAWTNENCPDLPRDLFTAGG